MPMSAEQNEKDLKRTQELFELYLYRMYLDLKLQHQQNFYIAKLRIPNSQ